MIKKVLMRFIYSWVSFYASQLMGPHTFLFLIKARLCIYMSNMCEFEEIYRVSSYCSQTFIVLLKPLR